jgi:homoserine O-acetyltransferase
LRAVIGASIGGMQALEWAVRYPNRVRDCVAIGATPLSALGLAQNHLQRLAIQSAADPKQGIRIARAIAMCTYKSAELFEERHGRRENRKGEAPWRSREGRFDVAGYLDHQGEVFEARFDPDSYVAITRAMDLWDPERLGGSVWERIEARVTLVGISSDWLFPASDVRALGARLRRCGVECDYREIDSLHGHDSFLAEPEHVFNLLHELLNLEPGRTAAAIEAYQALEDHSGTTC